MSTPSLLDAIRLAKDNEKIASETYSSGASRITNPLGKELFEQLSKFEDYHYELLTALERSLEQSDEFIDYEGKEFPLPPVLKPELAMESNRQSVMGIITAAVDLERRAEDAYAELAARITDRRGHEMFSKLSEEEHKHYLLLRDAYWTLNNMAMWTWSRP